jgi:predicted HAD superfamily phosphohydrolase YqeG
MRSKGSSTVHRKVGLVGNRWLTDILCGRRVRCSVNFSTICDREESAMFNHFLTICDREEGARGGQRMDD